MESDRSKAIIKYAGIGAVSLFGAYLLYRSVSHLFHLNKVESIGAGQLAGIISSAAGGSRQKLVTSQVPMQDGNIRFCVSLLDNSRPKPQKGEEAKDPFLPPFEPGIHICDLNENYRLLFNKFYVCDNHLLIVSKEFEPQTRFLTKSDFQLLKQTTSELNALAFFNSGPESGYSQDHKHIQLIPIANLPHEPLEVETHSIPLDRGITTLPKYNFQHLVLRFRSDVPAEDLYSSYLEMMSRLDVDPTSHSYNFLMTSSWMMVVLRSKESSYQRIPVNALGFVGLILVKNQEDVEYIQKLGPLAIIRDVGVRL